MIRAALRFVAWGDRKAVTTALRPVYGADTEEAAKLALDAFEERWGAKYPLVKTATLKLGRRDEARARELGSPSSMRRLL